MTLAEGEKRPRPAQRRRQHQLTPRHPPLAVATRPRPMPVEVRGVHVTGALASLPGKLDEYVG